MKIRKFIEIAACPVCNGEISMPDESVPELFCPGCGRKFPIKEGIPVMLTDAEFPCQD